MKETAEEMSSLRIGKWSSSSVYSVDAESGVFNVVYLRPGLVYDYKKTGDWDELVHFYADNVVRSDFKEGILDSLLLENIKKHFANSGPIAVFEYKRNEKSQSGWCMAEVTMTVCGEDGSVKNFIVTIRDVTEKVENELSQKKTRECLEAFGEGLKAVHDSELIVNMDTQECRFLKVSPSVKNDLPETMTLDAAMKFFSRMLGTAQTEEENSFQKTELTRIYHCIKENTFVRGQFEEIRYHRTIDGVDRWFRMSATAARFDESGKAHYAVVNTTDITSLMNDKCVLEQTVRDSDEKLRKEMAMLRSFRNIYSESVSIDVKTGEMAPVAVSEEFLRVIDSYPQNVDSLKLFADMKFMNAGSFGAFLDLDTLDERFENTSVLSTEYKGTDGKWYKMNLLPVNYDEDGSLSHVILALQDVTKEVEREQKYVVQLRSLTYSFERCLYHDIDSGEFTVINGRDHILKECRGEPADKILERLLEGREGERRALHIVHDLDTLNLAMKTRNTISREFKTADDEWKIEEVIAISRHPDRTLRSIMMTQRDITKRRREQVIMNAMSEAIGRTYMEFYHYDLVNWRCYTIRADVLSGQSDDWSDIDDALSAFEANVLAPEAVIENRDFWDFHTIKERMKDKDILSREIKTRLHGWVQFDIVAFKRDKDGDVIDVLWMTREIDEQKKLQLQQQEELRRANEAAMAATKSKTDFLTNMSHDIRTPMNAIMGFVNIAEEHIDDRERVKDCIDKIHSSSAHLLNLINDVLEMSHIESGRMDMNEKPGSIPDMIHSVVSIIQPQAEARRLSYSIKVVNLEHEYVYTDSSKLSRVLINLLNNAVKYTKPGGQVKLTIEEYPSARPGFAGYRFIISDTGQGMSEEFLQKVFTPFERESKTIKNNVEGTGLGLSISKNIIDAMGGTLGVESRIGEGTTFTVDVEQRISEEEDNSRDTEHLKGLRALIIDDDEEACDRITMLLTELGLRAEEAKSAGEFTIYANLAADINDPYMVYIIDESLPDADAVDLAARLRHTKGIENAAVILTSYDHSRIVNEAEAAGFTGFCDKPVFRSDLEKALDGSSDTEICSAADKEELIKRTRLLLVEDNDLNREIAEVVLSEAGFMIESASDGQEALDALNASKENYFDVVLMDIQMPVMDGYEATRQIRASERLDLADIPIVAMSANAFEEDRKLSEAAGMNDHISKPIDIDLTVKTILKFVKRK